MIFQTHPLFSGLARVGRALRRRISARNHLGPPTVPGNTRSRLGVEATYADQYRLRLIAAEVIEPRGHGLVDFTLPGLRDYLREHAASMPDSMRTGGTYTHPDLRKLADSHVEAELHRVS